MMLPIVGSIRNTVKMAEMDNKWQQKKKRKSIESGNESSGKADSAI